MTVRGFTLIELLITTTILSVLLSVGIPSFRGMVENQQAKTSLSVLRKTLHQARTIALEQMRAIIVCPMQNNNCVNDWGQPLAVFTDINNNYQLDSNESLHLKLSNEDPHGYWQKKRASQNYIRFNSRGHAFSSATTFLYCPNSGKTSYAKQLIINFQGRIRIDTYLNHLGTPHPNVHPLSCS